jgi:hypothetical protein
VVLEMRPLLVGEPAGLVDDVHVETLLADIVEEGAQPV